MLSEAKHLPQKRAAQFRRALSRWYRRNGRDLPWRQTRDPYAIFISEVMLQQTQVATVIPYYERWLQRFPNVSKLARANESDVLHAWQGLGYYTRARNLHRVAKLVREKFRGRFPSRIEDLIALPGIGRYSANAIATFAFDRPVPIVEANIARLLARLTNCKIPIESAAGRAHLWQSADALLPATGARKHNSALIDLGATICLPRQPRCGECPVRRFCRADEPETLPRKKRRPSLIRLTEPHTFARRRNRVLLEQSHQRWRGMWIMPRLRLTPKRSPLLELDFPFTHHRITLAVFDGIGAETPNDRQRWFPLEALEELPVPSPHRRALAQLLPATRRARH
jgi:A/G-specific adenine glycosylase